MFKKIACAVLAAIVIYLGYVATLPSHYKISRSTVIATTPDKIYAQVINPKLMDQWNPFAEMDPTAKISYAGPESGVGAKSQWADGKELGTGSATVTQVVPNQSVDVKLEYTKPWTMSQDVKYTIMPQGNQTEITWSVEGDSNYVSRIFCTLTMTNMEKMIGGMFEKGLGKLKTILETK